MRKIQNLMFGVMFVLAACTTNATDTSTSSEVTLRVAFWDYTENGITERPEIWLRDSGDSWLPEMEHRFDKHTYSSLPLGTTQTFMFDAFGNDQSEISVDVPITDALCPSGCVADTLNFGVWDDYIAVWGVVESHVADRLDHEHSSQQLPLQIRLTLGR